MARDELLEPVPDDEDLAVEGPPAATGVADLTELDELPRIFFRAAPPVDDANGVVIAPSPVPTVAAEATGAILAFSGGFLDDED